MSAVNIPGSNTAVNINVRALGTSSSAPVTYKTKILKPNLVNDVNVLTQAMLDISGANTKFVIKYNFTLSENIEIPNYCILEFDGGKIINNDNYNITCNSTKIVNIYNYTIFDNIVLSGTYTTLTGSYV